MQRCGPHRRPPVSDFIGNAQTGGALMRLRFQQNSFVVNRRKISKNGGFLQFSGRIGNTADQRDALFGPGRAFPEGSSGPDRNRSMLFPSFPDPPPHFSGKCCCAIFFITGPSPSEEPTGQGFCTFSTGFSTLLCQPCKPGKIPDFPPVRRRCPGAASAGDAATAPAAAPLPPEKRRNPPG